MGIRTAFDRFLRRLAKAADEQYGGKPPDCCAGKPAGGRKVTPHRLAKDNKDV